MDDEQKNKSRVGNLFMGFGNICALNVLWILFSIPFFTIGASTTAMHSMMLKLIKNEEPPIFKGFWKAFKENFKKATLSWLIMLAVAVVIYVQLTYADNFTGMLPKFYLVVSIVEAFLWGFVMAYLFPLIARYENTVVNTIKNAFLLAISQLGSTLKILVAWVLPIYLTTIPAIFMYTWYLWLILGFGFIFFGTSFTLRKVFKKIDEKSTVENTQYSAKGDDKDINPNNPENMQQTVPAAPKSIRERAAMQKKSD